MRLSRILFTALLAGAITACGGDESGPPDAQSAPGSAVATGRLPSGEAIDSTRVPQDGDTAQSAAERPGATPPAPGRATPGAPAATPPPAADAQDPAAILRRTAATYEGIRSLKADFTMVVENPLLRSRTTSRGTLYQRRPDRILLDFSEPDGDVIVSDGTYFWIYYPSVNADQVIRSPAAQASAGGVDLQAQFVGDPTERFEYTLDGEETMNGRRVHIFTLVPRTDAGYRQLKAWIDAEDTLVRRFELTEMNGSVRQFELSAIERNPSLADELFRFTPPPNARVITR
jgi:outer membrane lipoprotein carrier protein